MFEGHQLYTIDNYWVFDITTFIGYRIELDKDKRIMSYDKAYVLTHDTNNNSYEFYKLVNIPLKILRKTMDIIHRYRKEALLDYGS